MFLQTCERILSVLQQPIIIEKHRLTINAQPWLLLRTSEQTTNN